LKFSAQLLLTTLSKSTTHISIFVLSIILSRYFTKDDYGTYLHIQLITNLSVWAFLLGIPHGIYYFLPKSENQRAYVMTVMGLISSIAIIVSGIIAWTSDGLSNFLSNPRISDLTPVLFCMILFQIPLTVFEPLMISTKRVKEFAATQLLFNALFFCAVAIPVMFDCSMVEILWWLAAVYAFNSAVVFYFALTIAFSFRGKQTQGEAFSLAQQIRYTLPIGLSMNVMELSRYVDKVVVSNQSNAEDYAVYTRGAMEIPVIGIIANTLDNLMMPKFIEAYKNKNIDEILDIWHGAIRLMAAFIYPSCLFLIFTAPLLIPAIFSDKYASSVIIFQIYTLGLLSRISTFDIIMRAIGRTKAILWITLFSVIVNLILTYWFMSLWGLMGAPIATVITMLAMRIGYLKAITGYFDISLNAVFPWASLGKSLLASVVSAIPVFYMLSWNINVWILLLSMGVAFSAIYLVLIRVLDSLTERDKSSVRDVLPSRLKWVV